MFPFTELLTFQEPGASAFMTKLLRFKLFVQHISRRTLQPFMKLGFQTVLRSAGSFKVVKTEFHSLNTVNTALNSLMS
jgi:hypothetical protein